MQIREAINTVVSGDDLGYEDMLAVTREIMSGGATDAQIAGFLIGLRMKGESVDEITAAATVMRELSSKVVVDRQPLIDTCGTGGDGSRLFNVSTAAAFVVAAAGGFVAKHGNRSVSSSSGSADVLEAAGARIDLAPTDVARCIERTGVGFMFAPRHHGAMRHAAGPRRELGTRTLFNGLGPLTNPANAPIQLIGVFAAGWVPKTAAVLVRLGTRRAMVVHSDDGLDEISAAARTHVAEVEAGKIREFEINPADFGFNSGARESLEAADAAASLRIIQAVYRNEAGAARDTVAMNAGAAIYLAGLAGDLGSGVARALELIAEGAAAERFERFIRCTHEGGAASHA